MLNIRHTCLRLLFTPQNIHHHLNDWTCYIAGFLHQCICTPQHTPGDGSFYFVCITEPTFNTVVALQSCHMHLRSTSFRGYIFSQISRFLAIFTKLNTRKIFLDVKFAKINTREIFLQLKFAKLIPAKKAKFIR